eukprot:12324171-Ditylum_brightwellii.AAC.1
MRQGWLKRGGVSVHRQSSFAWLCQQRGGSSGLLREIKPDQIQYHNGISPQTSWLGEMVPLSLRET